MDFFFFVQFPREIIHVKQLLLHKKAKTADINTFANGGQITDFIIKGMLGMSLNRDFTQKWLQEASTDTLM